jgi:alkylation response protein AidB-like acyl-CoA dehydrogenase
MMASAETGRASRWNRLDLDTLRAEFQRFLAENPPGRPPRNAQGQLEWRQAWARTKFEHGIAAPAWPTDWYGMGLTLSQLVVYHEEMAAARAPGAPSPGAGMVGPAILQHGTDEQRKRFLPRLLRGEDLWCQGFSEPGAGSDLPSLRTRAVRDGDVYVVTGQKVWTTMATQSNWCFALVRTGSTESRQRGITYLLIDMSLPGVEVRPLRTMAGNYHFAELFFDGVRVPVDCRIGEDNDGWRVTRTTLGHERSTNAIGRDAVYRSIVADLIELAAQNGKRDDPTVRQQLAELVIGARLVEWSGHRMLQRALQSGDVGPLSSTARLFSTRYEQILHEVAMGIIGPQAMLAPQQLDRHIGRWINGFLMTRATTIGGGTSQIQLNTIAEQVLGLPHDPGMPER